MPRILVANDEPDIGEVITRILSNEGHEVIEAADGGSAYVKAVSESPDIVLLDINMPVMSGLLVLHDLKRNPETESIPVIILTSSHLPRDEMEGMREGALDFITKPWGPGELEDRIRMALAYLESRTPDRTSPVAGTSPSSGDYGNKPKLSPGAALPGLGRANSNPRDSSLKRQGRPLGPEIGRPSQAFPVTPPCVRVRIRRFGGLSGQFDARREARARRRKRWEGRS